MLLVGGHGHRHRQEPVAEVCLEDEDQGSDDHWDSIHRRGVDGVRQQGCGE